MSRLVVVTQSPRIILPQQWMLHQLPLVRPMIPKCCVHESSTWMVAENRESLIKEADMVIACGSQGSHGPDSIDDLSDFSIDAVIAEFQSYAPSLYAFFQQFGHTHRNSSDTSLPVEEMKALMALCTLMNARSNRFKGLQLLLSMMFIARATNKQVKLF